MTFICEWDSHNTLFSHLLKNAFVRTENVCLSIDFLSYSEKKSFFLSNCVYNCIFPSKIILFAHMLTSIRYRVSAQLQIDANWNFFIVSKCNLNVLTFICTKRPSGRVTVNYTLIEFHNIQFHAENDSVFLKFC